ncbi:leucine rich repeat containing 66 [Maylandia zebra]|uniref:leucine rich repeat containing 66 n=1 Tax=Maylandia zebra TaxID=106582 RepID=UPI00403CE559
MAAPQGPFLAAVLVLVSSLLCSSSSPACLQSCTCQSAFLLNCSSAGLSSVPQHIQDSVTELDFSHNLLKSVTFHQPHYNLRSVWLGNNSITRLSLCTGRNLGGQHRRDKYRSRPWTRRKCVSWAPTLQLLSVEMNQLRQLPEGLEGIESLEVLQLSFNRISTLRLGELSHLQQLKELHLQHNLITSLHPQMFQDLPQLKVLDLSFNMLTSIHPLMYLTLQNIGTEVRLLGNRWQCDCRMHSLRRRIAFDSNRGLQVWSIMCASPSTLSGRDLLQLQDDELNCLSTGNIPELHQDVTVHRGSEILLSCSAEDSVWWTPNGQMSVNQSDGGLLISDITESDTGLYVCVSKEKQVVSVFNLQISKIGGARRKPRSLSETSQYIIQAGPTKSVRNGTSPGAGAVTQSDLALAVCLSIFITFLIAFILGVLARPCIDALWKRVTEKNINTRSRETNSAVSVEQTQYDNEAFSTGEELERTGHHRERRVTFTTVDYREHGNVQYYDTVVSGNPESINNDVVIDCEVSEAQNIKHTPEDSGNESSSHQSNSEGRLNDGRDHTTAGHRHNMEFEPIPDPVELEEKRSLSSSSSDSSLSEKEFKEHHTMPKAPKVTKDPFQQKTDFSILTKEEVPQRSLEGKSKMPGFTSEPWSPHTTDPGYLEENEELFEFSDSVQSPSPRSGSIIGSSNKSKLTVATPSKKHKRDSVSSSSSNSSEDESTLYKANSDQQIKPAVKPEHSFSSDSSDSDKEPDQHTVKLEIDKDSTVKVKPKPRTKWHDVYSDTSQSKNLDAKAPSLSIRDSSSSSSDSEADSKVHSSIDRKSQIKEHSHITAPLPESNSSSRSMRKDSDIKEPSSASSSSSSSESDDEAGHKVQQVPGKLGIPPCPFKESQTKSPDPNAKWPTIDLLHIPHIKRRLDIKASSVAVGSDTTSSSESEEETTKHIKKQEQGGIYMPIVPNRSSQKINQEDNIRRPAIPPERPRSIKKDLDLKEPSSASSSSSSSESDDEAGHKVQQVPGKLGIPPRPFKESQTKSPDPNAKWPTIDLLHIPHIKRRLDIKAPSVAVGSDTTSSSESEEETTKHIKKQEQGGIYMPIVPDRSSQKINQEDNIRRPAIPPERPRSIKKDLDLKEPSSASSSSSSSESDDEAGHKVQQSPGKLDIPPRPFKESQTKSPDPNAKWPTIDLLHIPHIKRRLDIKAPSKESDTSSSSDSEEETTKHIKKQEQGGIYMPIVPNRSSQKINQEDNIRRPAIPPERPRSIKKDLDLKEPSSASSSSSSSESDDEAGHKGQQSPGKLGIPPLPFKESQTKSPDPNAKWPTIDLLHIPHIKRRLDIKASSVAVGSDTTSSSESEEETTKHIKKQVQGGIYMPIVPDRSSQKINQEDNIRRPAIPPECPRSIKKDLDIKEPSSASSSSSSSESDDEAGHKGQQSPGKLGIPPRPFKESQTRSPDPNAKWPTIDLLHIPHIKRRLDIKAPSKESDTSSSSDSEEETTKHIKKQEQGGIYMPIVPNRSSQKINQEDNIQRPAIPPERPRSIKKDSDAKEPSSASSSSSSSESDDEAGHKGQQSPGKLGIPPRPFKESQTRSPDPNAKWPTIDLLHIPHIKRCLDIKAPSVDSDTSSSSDSEEETVKKQDHGAVHIPILPNRSSQKASREHDIRRPAIPPERPRSIKKDSDIKEPSSASSSSSSSESDDEAGHKVQQVPGKLGIPPRPFRESQTKSPDPNAKWPTIDLLHIPHIKRRLDIKAPSKESDTSSSSDSEEETTKHIKKQEQGGIYMPIVPNRSSQKINQEDNIRRPAIPPERPRSIKKDSDIKEPSSASSSSSSSESDDEAGHKVQQVPGKLGIPPRPFRESQTKSPDPNAKWPTIDLLHIPHIKRRLDIKASSVAVGSDTTSSSESEEETTKHIKKQEQGGIYMPIVPDRSSQKINQEDNIRRSAIPPECPRSIKKDLDIKEPSSASSSSSSSESDDEAGHKGQQSPGKLGIPPRPFKESQTKSPDPNAKWPTIDLLHIPHIKRRLDIKAPSKESDTSSSSDSEEETTKHIKKQEQGGIYMPIVPNRSSQKINQEDNIRRPAIPPERPRSIKKDSDIKEPSSASSSSSSSESDDEAGHKVQQVPGKLGIPPRPFRESQTKSPDPNAKWPNIDLLHIPRVKRRLDIKAPSVDSDTSSSSDSEEETTKHIKKQEQEDIYSPRQETDLLYTKTQYVHHTADIKSVLSTSESSSSSDSEDEKRGQTKKQSLGSTGFQQSQTKRHDPIYTSSSSDEEGMEDLRNRPVAIKPDSRLPEIGLSTIPYVKKHLDIKTRSPKSSSSSDESEGRTTDQPVKMASNLGSPTSTLFKLPHISKKDSNITLEKYVVITDELTENRKDNFSTTPEINSELQSRWATMNLGFSQFRKRLEITSPSSQPSKYPSSPLPDSSSLNPENKHVKPSDSSSSSSSSEDEITENRAPPGMTYVDFPIYKRSIMKTSSLSDSSFSPSGKTQMVNVAQESEKDRNSSLAPKRVSSLSFEDEVRRRTEQRHNANADIPPEIKWTGVGHHLSKISTPALKTGLNTTPPQQASPAKPELPQLYSSSIKSDVKIKQDSWKSDVKPTHKFSSISANSTSSASGGALHRLYNSPNTTYENPSPILLSDRKERKGLSALKVMSSERKMWDTVDFSGDVSPTADDHSPQVDTGVYYRKSKPDIKPLPRSNPSASPDERRATDLLYDLPRYRSHDIKPPQVAPPPIPVTLPPEEAVGLTGQ